jgi:hypothetical protein
MATNHTIAELHRGFAEEGRVEEADLIHLFVNLVAFADRFVVLVVDVIVVVSARLRLMQEKFGLNPTGVGVLSPFSIFGVGLAGRSSLHLNRRLDELRRAFSRCVKEEPRRGLWLLTMAGRAGSGRTATTRALIEAPLVVQCT